MVNKTLSVFVTFSSTDIDIVQKQMTSPNGGSRYYYQESVIQKHQISMMYFQM